MERERIERFLAEPRNVIVAAIRKDGRPQMTPNWFHWDGNQFWISTTRSRYKYRNLTRDPRCQLLFDDAAGALLVDGQGEIREDLNSACHVLRAVNTKHGDAFEEAEMREQAAAEGRVAIVVTPDRPVEEWTGWFE